MMLRATSAMAGVVLLSLWLGAALIVAAVVAPAAFAVLPSRTLAGALVGRVLPTLFWAGMLVGLVVAATTWGLPSRGWRIGAALVLVLACAVAQLVIDPRIERVRAAIGGPVDALDPASPLRQAFGRLHGMSVVCLGIGGLAAILALVLLLHLTAARTAP